MTQLARLLTLGALLSSLGVLACSSDPGADEGAVDVDAGGGSADGAASGGANAGLTGGAPGLGGTGGGTGGTGGAPGDGKPPAVPSVGCGKPLGALTSGTHVIRSSNKDREYTIDVPTSYDPNEPYRLVFAWHWVNASDDAVVNGEVAHGGPVWAYYGLKNQSQLSGIPAIFIAPQSRNGRWDQEDHLLFDDLLAYVESELCVDTGRVFATGFSFGAMQTYSLSTSHQSQLRAVSAIAPANFNIYLPTNTHEPIAYMSSTGMSDTLCYWSGDDGRGAKFAALGHAEDNGCTLPPGGDVPTTSIGSKTHLCYDFEGCDAGYPVKACTYDGGHIAAPADGGTSDNGATSWIPPTTWEFFTQF